MQDIVKKDILSVLRQAIEILEKKDFNALSELSNHTVHDASIFQDDDSVSIAVLIYALSKVIQRCSEKGIDYNRIPALLKKAEELLNKEEEKRYADAVKQLFSEVKKLDEHLGLFITEVLDKARIKKGSKLHEHGISIARTSELMGISQWELMTYVGKVAETPEKPAVSVAERLSFARELFG